MRTAELALGHLTAQVVWKDIKNVHLSVHPPKGRVSIAAPLRMNIDTLRVFTIAKLPWIKRQQALMQAQVRETPREYIERESHFVWGQRYLLRVVEHAAPPQVLLKARHLELRLRPGTSMDKRAEILQGWYRQQLRLAAEPLLEAWSKRMGVAPTALFVQHMKTRWGSCNHQRGFIRLNTELAKKPRECLEYLVVHELAHLIEPTHNARFHAVMDQFLPQWEARRALLSSLPVRHEAWVY